MVFICVPQNISSGSPNGPRNAPPCPWRVVVVTRPSQPPRSPYSCAVVFALPHDTVLISDREFPAVVYPFLLLKEKAELLERRDRARATRDPTIS